MKTKKILLLLLVAISLTACVDETITRKISGKTIPPEYLIERERLQGRIATLIPADDIQITTSKTETSGEPEVNTLIVEVFQPEIFPPNGFSFNTIAGNIEETVVESIGNIKDFQKMEIRVSRTWMEDGYEQSHSFRKEFDL